MSELERSKTDVAIIGGGSAGLGVARAVAERGLSVALFEREECGRATSDNSLRIIHGGFRYLQSLDIPRVIESMQAQAALVREFPDIVVALPCVMPLARVGLKSKWPLTIAQALFRTIGVLRGSGAPPVGFLSPSEVDEVVPCMKGRCRDGALLWTDALMLDQRELLRRWGERCRSLGASLYEHTPVIRIEPSKSGVVVETRAGLCECRVVVNTAGPLIETIPRSDGVAWPSVGGYARAFNVIVRPDLVGRYGVALSGENRLLFAVRRDGNTAIGTGYLPAKTERGTAIAESEVAAFLIEASRSLPEPLTLSDVVGVESGLLPVTGWRERNALLLGRERIVRQGRVVTVISTKYTTFHEQGKRVAKVIRGIV